MQLKSVSLSIFSNDIVLPSFQAYETSLGSFRDEEFSCMRRIQAEDVLCSEKARMMKISTAIPKEEEAIYQD